MSVRLYKVGGCVRDKFLGVQSKDIDYAVEAPSFEVMRDYIAEHGTIFLEKPEYLTIRGKINGEAVDFVLCRKDGKYTDGRRPDKVEAGTIFDDLARRDFTMNAIAEDEDGDLVDPYCGRYDIERQLIKCVGDARDRINEDPLRLLRAFRFSITKKFIIHPDITTMMYSEDVLNKMVETVSLERIKDELQKCFVFDTLKTLDALDRFQSLRAVIFGKTDLWLNITNKNR